MDITVPNTRPDQPRVTLFGQLADGSFAARVMEETSVPYQKAWDNLIEQRVVYIDPDQDALDQMLAALREGRLAFSHLQDYGAANGGSSTIPV
jgi:hypothetical protein